MTYQPPSSSWPPEKVERLTHLWVETQITAQAIANELGFDSRSAVTGKVWRLGLIRKNPRWAYQNNKANAQKSALKNKLKCWPPEILEKATRMWKDRYPQHVIAGVIGKSCCAVNKKFTRMGMTRRRPLRPHLKHPGRVTGTTPKPPRISPEAAWQPLPDTIPIEFERTNIWTCKWPIGEFPFLFCGQLSFKRNYCRCHYKMSVTG